MTEDMNKLIDRINGLNWKLTLVWYNNKNKEKESVETIKESSGILLSDMKEIRDSKKDKDLRADCLKNLISNSQYYIDKLKKMTISPSLRMFVDKYLDILENINLAGKAEIREDRDGFNRHLEKVFVNLGNTNVLIDEYNVRIR